jgi:hypothetical protein
MRRSPVGEGSFGWSSAPVTTHEWEGFISLLRWIDSWSTCSSFPFRRLISRLYLLGKYLQRKQSILKLKLTCAKTGPHVRLRALFPRAEQKNGNGRRTTHWLPGTQR